MALILGIIVGVLIGAGGVYLLLNQKIAQRDQEIRQHKRVIEDLEKSRESRLQETVQSLQSDYQQKLNQKTTELTQTYEQRIQELTQQASQPQASQPESGDAIASPTSSTSPDQAAQPSPSIPPAELSVASEETAQAATRLAEEPSETLSAPAPIPSEPTELPEVSPVRPEASVEQRQDLIDSILKMGSSRNMNHLLELQRLSMTSSRDVREASAVAMGNIITAHAGNPAVAHAVPGLGKLSQDPDALVRCAAITALGHTQSPKAIPFIRRSLRDSNLQVVKAANDAIGRFKYFRSPNAKQSPSKKKQSKRKQV